MTLTRNPIDDRSQTVPTGLWVFRGGLEEFACWASELSFFRAHDPGSRLRVELALEPQRVKVKVIVDRRDIDYSKVILK